MPERPEDVEVERTRSFLLPHLGSARRILDVGCGNGLLARSLAEAGRDVTALDRSLKRTEKTDGIRFVESDFLLFEDAPYDVLVFSASLHHLFPLDGALDAAARLLRPGGVLLASDFDLEAPDLATARWYYDVEGLLVAAGLYRPDKVGASDVENPLARWHAEHLHSPPFHSGAAMREGVERFFTETRTSTGPYLYRYVVGGLEATPKGTELALWALATEERHLQEGSLKPVGMRFVARKAAEKLRR